MNKKIILSTVLSALIVVTLASVTFFSIKYNWLSVFQKEGTGSTIETNAPPEEPPELEKLDTKLTGAWLVPEVDYPINGIGDETASMIESKLNEIVRCNFTSVIVPLQYCGQPLYYTGENKEPPNDIISQIITKAHGKGLKVHAVYDTTVYYEEAKSAESQADASSQTESSSEGTENNTKAHYNLNDQADLKAVSEVIASVAGKYQFDALLLENTYVIDPSVTGEDLVKATTNAVMAIKKEIRRANHNLYVGALVAPVWENKSKNENGSDTNSDLTDLSKGADTYTWVKENIVDFVMVKTNGSQKDAKEPFEKVALWWDEAVKDTKTALFISHAANNVGKKLEGWGESDQLSKQVLFVKGLENCLGSSFYTLSDLMADKTGSTEVMLKCFISEASDLKFTDMSFSKPEKTTMTTNEPKLQFYGISDPNFKLTVNGAEWERDESGIIDKFVDLKIGDNVFKFENKGKITEFKITYKVVILKSIEPTENIELSGGSELIFTATALKGAKVTATINKKSITLSQSSNKSKDDAASEDYGEFCQYTGTYKLPAEKKTAQNLGRISITASQNGLKESKSGGAVTVKALPPEPVEIIKPDKDIEIPDTVVGDIKVNMENVIENTLSKTTAKGKLITVTRYKAETFNIATGTSIDWSRPENAYLPKGTQDVSTGDAASGSVYYEKLNFGKMVYRNDTSVGNNVTLELKNELAFTAAEVRERTTVFTLNSLRKAPLGVQVLPQAYGNPATQDYKITSFTAEYVEISFNYATKLVGVPVFEDNHPLFRKAEVFKGTDKIVLRMYFRVKGGFYGWNAEYNDKNQLVLTFLHPFKVKADSKPLAGSVILLDPGHGGSPDKNKDPYATTSGTANRINGVYYTEKAINLSLSQKIKARLEAMGATVLMTRTSDVTKNYNERLTMCYEKQPNLFISVHHNGGASTAYGLENYYFTPYSQNAALRIYNKILGVFQSNYNNSNAPNRGNRWGPYYANRVSICPSMLIEYGYMSNYNECAWIIQASTQDKFAEATAQGILDYFKNIQ